MTRLGNGLAMRAVAAYVRQHPGCCKYDVNQNTGAAYTSIDRAVAAGMIRAERQGSYRYRLYPGQPALRRTRPETQPG